MEIHGYIAMGYALMGIGLVWTFRIQTASFERLGRAIDADLEKLEAMAQATYQFRCLQAFAGRVAEYAKSPTEEGLGELREELARMGFDLEG